VNVHILEVFYYFDIKHQSS